MTVWLAGALGLVPVRREGGLGQSIPVPHVWAGVPTVLAPAPRLPLSSSVLLLQHCRSPEPVRRRYPDGQTFFLLFPDGSGQV